MIIGVISIVIGEAFYLNSMLILIWAVVFFAMNTVYFELIEEPPTTTEELVRLARDATLDKDDDGKLSKEEVPERMQQRFDQIDGNSDGFIDKAEMDQLIANIRRRFQQAGQRPGQPGQQRRRPDPNAGQGGADKPKRPALEDE